MRSRGEMDMNTSGSSWGWVSGGSVPRSVGGDGEGGGAGTGIRRRGINTVDAWQAHRVLGAEQARPRSRGPEHVEEYKGQIRISGPQVSQLVSHKSIDWVHVLRGRCEDTGGRCRIRGWVGESKTPLFCTW